MAGYLHSSRCECGECWSEEDKRIEVLMGCAMAGVIALFIGLAWWLVS